MLSKVLFLRWFTTITWNECEWSMLWIAFKSSIFTMIYNHQLALKYYVQVVNCFQKFYFYDDLQLLRNQKLFLNSCELLSKVLFLRWFTTCLFLSCQVHMLWIAFKSSIFTMIYNRSKHNHRRYIVVNCFQKFYFYDDLQRCSVLYICSASCELLSKVLFLRWFTTILYKSKRVEGLWIAFKSSIFTMIYNLQADSQNSKSGCELLSKVLFLRWFTTQLISWLSACLLWIAFKSSIFTMIYNNFYDYQG